MDTEEQQRALQIKLYNSILVGFAKGMYELFGEAAVATIDEIGSGIVQSMEHELGLEIKGENPQAMLVELSHVLVDKFGMCKHVAFSITNGKMKAQVDGCMGLPATRKLTAAGDPPFTCVPLMIAKSLLNKRLGQKAQFVDFNLDSEKDICDIEYRLV